MTQVGIPSIKETRFRIEELLSNNQAEQVCEPVSLATDQVLLCELIQASPDLSSRASNLIRFESSATVQANAWLPDFLLDVVEQPAIEATPLACELMGAKLYAYANQLEDGLKGHYKGVDVYTTDQLFELAEKIDDTTTTPKAVNMVSTRGSFIR